MYGFYPVSKSLRTVLSLDVPGELRVAFDRPKNASVSVVIATSRQEEARIHAYLEQILGQQRLAAHGVGVPPTYNLAGRNCATLVSEALRAGGIDSSTSAIPLYFIRDLQQLHGTGVNVWPMP